MSLDFDDKELKSIHDTLSERYREAKEIQLADVELHMNPDDQEATECPSVYWEHNGCHFILSKVEKDKFCSQFFYDDKEQYGTGKKYYDDLSDCLMSTLQIQADYERQKNMQQESLLTK